MDRETTTHMLREAANGRPEARERVLVRLHDDLLALAARRLKDERPGHTLDPEALVSELFLRYLNDGAVVSRDRQEFLGLANTILKNVLIDHARKRGAGKRPPAHLRVSLPDLDRVAGQRSASATAEVADVLDRLERVNAEARRVFELRVFGGYRHHEVAEITGLRHGQVRVRWAFAKAWIERELGPG